MFQDDINALGITSPITVMYRPCHEKVTGRTESTAQPMKTPERNCFHLSSPDALLLTTWTQLLRAGRAAVGGTGSIGRWTGFRKGMLLTKDF